jgi:hypothetical protein
MTHMSKKIILISLIVVCCTTLMMSQRFGIRAGLNYNKFSGPVEVGEKFSLTNGFHFGFNYAYKLSDIIAVRGEIVYTQTGTNYDFEGSSYYKVPLSSGLDLVPNAFIYEKGQTKMNLKVSNAYISLPITMTVDIKKFELCVGIYGSALILPRGSGTVRFTSDAHPDSLFFKQSFVHNYNKDIAGGSTGLVGPAVFVGDAVVPIARDAGAYYNYLKSELNGTLYKGYDFGLTGGVSYFINKGLYAGLRFDYGLVDLTNNKVDVSRKSYDESINRFKFSNDFDRNFGFQVSFGFRF